MGLLNEVNRGVASRGRDDLLAVLVAALRWINRVDVPHLLPTSPSEASRLASVQSPRLLMRALERALVVECDLSPTVEQDVHEALLFYERCANPPGRAPQELGAGSS